MFWRGSYETSLKDETQTGTLVPHATAPVSPILGGAAGRDRLLVSFQHKQCLLEGLLQLVDASFAWVSQTQEFGEGREGRVVLGVGVAEAQGWCNNAGCSQRGWVALGAALQECLC